MKKHEMISLLKEAGFSHLRSGKHEIWSDGISRITLPHCNRVEERLSKLMRLQIKRAIALRQSVQQQRASA